MGASRALSILAIACSVAGPILPQASCPTGALSFDGVNDRVTVPYHSSFPTTVFSAGAWIRATTPTRNAAVIARGEDNSSFNLVWQLYVTRTGEFLVMLEDNRERNWIYNSGKVVADDLWHHVAATRNSSGTLVMYVDGQAEATFTRTGVPSANNAQDLTIGCTHGTIGPPPGG